MKQSTDKVISRRSVLRWSASLVPALLSPTVSAQSTLKKMEHDLRISMKLEKVFPNGGSIQVSPDSTLGCLYLTNERDTKFKWSGGIWRQNNKSSNDELLVLEIGSWKILRSIQLFERFDWVRFFGEGKSIYMETASFWVDGKHISKRTIINIQSGKREDKLREVRANPLEIGLLNPADHGNLLGTERNGATGVDEALVLVAAPDYKEVRRVPLEKADPRTQTDQILSNDRKTFVDVRNSNVFYRRAEDLSVIWKQPFSDQMHPRWAMISADGSRAAVVLLDTYYIPNQHVCYIEVLNTKDGTQVARIPVNGHEGTAISPHGKLLAVSQQEMLNPKTRETRPTVNIYEVASGKRLTSITHDPLHPPGGPYIANLSPQFTSDGKYLISSGADGTKIWKIESSEII